MLKAIIFPGQGSQYRGMGKDLFHAYPALTKQASDILGYSIDKLCLEDGENKLRLTQYTQPALFVVNALGYYKMRDSGPSDFQADFVAGHSLGEYNALLVSGAITFETGIKLVKKRGELMAAATGGGMAAIIGVNVGEIKQVMDENQLGHIDIANFNTPTQTVIAGTMASIIAAEKIFSKKGIRYVVLNVSAAFHSRYMAESKGMFARYLEEFNFDVLGIPVISNVTARPYENGNVPRMLANQIASPVLWTDSVRYLMGQGEIEFIEVGAAILSKMVNEIRKTESPIFFDKLEMPQVPPVTMISAQSVESVGEQQLSLKSPVLIEQKNNPETLPDKRLARAFGITAESLGNKIFRHRFGIKFAYISGAMYRATASVELVVRMGSAGLMGFYGSGGMSLVEIEKAIQNIQRQLSNGEPYGINLLANYVYPEFERATVELFLKYNIRFVEAAAFMKISSALVLFRVKGLRLGANGEILCEHKILAKISRPEVAEIFMSPAPVGIVLKLLNEGLITEEQAQLAKTVPMSHDVCVEADSGGHTDGGIATAMLPTMFRLRDEMAKKYAYQEPICMGLAGGLGTPEAVAAAFIMGADFVLTGSINQCTVEAGTSADVKNLLQDMNIQDTDYAPAGDMFEMGAKVQVLKKGVFFPIRANKLFLLYSLYNSLEEIPEKIGKQLQNTFFKKSFSEIWEETMAYFERHNQRHEIEKAQANPKHKMALVFRWYFAYSSRIAFEGKGLDRVNYQIHTGPALGAFNQWVKGTDLASWTERHVDEIGIRMMTEAAAYLNRQMQWMVNADGDN